MLDTTDLRSTLDKVKFRVLAQARVHRNGAHGALIDTPQTERLVLLLLQAGRLAPEDARDLLRALALDQAQSHDAVADAFDRVLTEPRAADINRAALRPQRQRGGQARAVQARAEALPPAVGAIFEQAHARLEADLHARIGRKLLLGTARRLVELSDPLRAELTERRARRWLEERRRPPAG